MRTKGLLRNRNDGFDIVDNGTDTINDGTSSYFQPAHHHPSALTAASVGQDTIHAGVDGSPLPGENSSAKHAFNRTRLFFRVHLRALFRCFSRLSDRILTYQGKYYFFYLHKQLRVGERKTDLWSKIGLIGKKAARVFGADIARFALSSTPIFVCLQPKG